MHEDSADSRGVGGGIQEGGLAVRAVIAAEERLAIAPAATGYKQAGPIDGLGDEVGAVLDQLGVET